MSTVPTWTPGVIATPGEAPDATRMGAVELLVRDLDAMTDFYHRAVTLEVMEQSNGVSVLGRAGLPSLMLKQEKNLPEFNRSQAGLYHTAFLFEDQERLASSLASMAQHASDKFEGSANHYVSEAFYFHDIEGNGIEIYRDFPREQWPLLANGQVNMGTEFLDPNQYLRDWYNPDAIVNDDSLIIGHVHLQVGDIPKAKAFYSGVLGFDVTHDLGTALFVSAGGYHHHIGMNTWHSAGAGPRAASLGLGDVRLVVPSQSDLEAMEDRLKFHGIASSHDGKTLRFLDPWGTKLAVSADE